MYLFPYAFPFDPILSCSFHFVPRSPKSGFDNDPTGTFDRPGGSVGHGT